MIVVLTETAIEDLVAIGRHIAEHNQQRAETFVTDLKSRCHQLGTMPKAFALVPRHEDTCCGRRRRAACVEVSATIIQSPNRAASSE